MRRTGSPPDGRPFSTFIAPKWTEQFIVHNSDLSTTLHAVLERIFLVKCKGGDKGKLMKFVDGPNPDEFARLNKIRSAILRSLPGGATPDTTEKFLTYYRGRKLLRYQRAAESLRTSDIERKDSFITGFVKREKINHTAKPNAVPRFIQPRSPRYNLMVGRYIKKLEKPLYKALDKICGETTVLKGLNALERGQVIHQKWCSLDNPVAVGMDASRFDQHVSVQALEWEHSIYNSHYNCSELRKLLRWQVNNKGFAYCDDGKIKYEVAGKRMSGDMNTSCGNVLIMVSLVYQYCIEVGIRPCFVNDGDDTVLFVERGNLSLLDGIPKWFKDFGFTMEVEKPVYMLEKVSFCQAQPVHDGLRYIMVRDPRVCLSKDLITIKNISTRSSWDYYRKAVSDCGMSLAGNMPMFKAFYTMLGRGAVAKPYVGEPETGMEFLAAGMDQTGEITQRARFSFYLAFDYTPDYQESVEQALDQMVVEYSRLRLVENEFTTFVFAANSC